MNQDIISKLFTFPVRPEAAASEYNANSVIDQVVQVVLLVNKASSLTPLSEAPSRKNAIIPNIAKILET